MYVLVLVKKNHLTSIACRIEGFLKQFSYMSTMFWLTGLSFSAWRAFRTMRARAPVNHGLGCWNPNFKWHALFAWGCPLLMTIITIIMMFLPDSLTDGLGLVLPNFYERDESKLETKPRTCSLDGEAYVYYSQIMAR